MHHISYKSFIERNYSIRYFYLNGVVTSMVSYWSLSVLPLKCCISWTSNKMGYLTFLCTTCGSLFLTSGLLSLSDIESAPSGLGLILRGRMKGHAGNRSLAKLNTLRVASFKNRILDIGYKTFISSLGVLGLKVGILL